MTQQSPVLQHPGEILLDQFLLPHYRSVGKAAQALDLSVGQLVGSISGEDRVTETWPCVSPSISALLCVFGCGCRSIGTTEPLEL